MTATKTLTVELQHHSSIPQARWCKPIGWEPTNSIPDAEFIDGSWWEGVDGEGDEAAGIVCFVQGDEGDKIEVTLDDLRVASCGNCRVIGEVRL